MKKTITIILIAAVLFILCSCAAQTAKKALIGTWEKSVDALGVATISVKYTFFEDGTCIQSTDLGQTSTWVFTDDTHVKITTPLNFTELYEIKQENGQWHLSGGGSDYVKVEG